MKKFNVVKRVSAVALAAVLLAGCGGSGSGDNGNTSGDSGDYNFTITKADIGDKVAPANYDYNSRDTLEISIMTTLEDPYSKDSTLVEEIEKATNTKLNIEYLSADSYQDRIAQKLAANELPDIIGRVPNINYMKNQYAAVPLQDYLKECAPDYLNKLTPEVLMETTDTETGNIYAMASIREVEAGITTMIRTDWLERVGKKVPQTWDDFKAVLKAFKDQDANGDGNPKNEIPFSGDLTYLRYAFGINSRYNFCVEDGEYKPVVFHSKYKEYLQEMQQMFAEGLIDAEYATRDPFSTLLTIMDNDMCGCTIHFAERAKLDTEALRDNGSEGQFEGIKPIQGPYGDSGIESQAGGIFNFCIASSVAEDKIPDLVRFMNYFYTEDGIKLMNYGIDGVHSDASKKGAPKLKQEFCDFVEARANGLIFQPLPFYWTTDSYMQMAMGGLTEDTMTETQRLFYDALNINKGCYVEKCPGLSTAAWNELQTEIEPMLQSFEANVITGSISMDQYDAELQKIKDAGLDRIAEEAKTAYVALTK